MRRRAAYLISGGRALYPPGADRSQREEGRPWDAWGGYTNISSQSSESRYRPGSEEDFERLYRASYRRVLGTLVGVLGDRAAAEDCAHDAFERAYRSWSRWRGDAPAEAWLHRIAINTAISHQRYTRMREVGEVIKRLGRPGPPADPAAAAERSQLIEALRRLPPKQAAAIVLRHYHGYTNREIGVALGVPERTVASRLAAAKARLRESLGYADEGRSAVDLGTLQQDGVPFD